MKTAEQQEGDLLVNIGRLSYCANQNDWKRFEMLLRAFTNQVQSDAIESTVRKCAEMCKEAHGMYEYDNIHPEPCQCAACVMARVNKSKILSLIPQKEKKVKESSYSDELRRVEHQQHFLKP